MPPNSIRLVCFDIGGVMVRICRSWVQGCTEAGLPLRDGALELLERAKNTRSELVRLNQTGRLDTDEYCRRVSEAIEGIYRPEEIRAIHDAWLLDAYVGLIEVIDAVHDAGLETACLSNINPEHWRRMSEYPAVMHLRHRFGSHELGHHKPDEAIYRALERALDVEGPRILFFDDLEENVEAARLRGWHAVHIDHEAATDRQITAALVEHGVLDAG